MLERTALLRRRDFRLVLHLLAFLVVFAPPASAVAQGNVEPWIRVSSASQQGAAASRRERTLEVAVGVLRRTGWRSGGLEWGAARFRGRQFASAEGPLIRESSLQTAWGTALLQLQDPQGVVSPTLALGLGVASTRVLRNTEVAPTLSARLGITARAKHLVGELSITQRVFFTNNGALSDSELTRYFAFGASVGLR